MFDKFAELGYKVVRKKIQIQSDTCATPATFKEFFLELRIMLIRLIIYLKIIHKYRAWCSSKDNTLINFYLRK